MAWLPGVRLLCCDVSEDYTAIAVATGQRAGVSDRIEHALADERVELVMLPLSDGLTLARKR